MSKYKNLFKNTIAMLIGNFASKILIFIMLPLYTTTLTTKEYGTADLIFTTTNLLFPLFTCLATEYVLRFALEKDQDKSRVFSSSVIVTVLGFVILLTAYPLLKNFAAMGNLWKLFYLYYISTTLCNIVSQFVKGLEKIYIYSISGVLNTFLVIICNIIFLLYFKWGIIGYIWSYIIGAVITIGYLWKASGIHKYLRFLTKEDIADIRIYFKYSLPMIPNSISWWISSSLDKYILTIFHGVAVTGIYAAGYKIPSFLTIVSSIFLSAWQISAVKDFGTEETRLFFSNIYRQYSSIVIILGGIVIIVSKFISKVLLSKEFFEAWLFAPILVYAYIFQTMSGFLGTVYTSSKKTSMLFISTAIGSVVNAILNIIFIPSFGSSGAAIATAFSYFTVWIIRLLHSRKKIIDLDINLKKDFFCYMLLMLITILSIQHSSYSMIVSNILLLLIIIFNKKCLRSISGLMYKTILKK